MIFPETKIAVIGSRNYPRMDLVAHFVFGLSGSVTIISGGAHGVDSVAENVARDRNMKLIIFPAEWQRYGKRAGFIRNQLIVEAADKVYAFWDGTSRGTKLTIDIAKRKGKFCVVVDKAGVYKPSQGA